MELVIVGSMAYDDISTDAGEVHHALGGAATYAGLASVFHVGRTRACHPVPAASEQGMGIGLVSVIGDDFEASDLEMLREHGLDLTGVEVIEGGRTFRWAGRYQGAMDEAETLGTQLNVLAGFSPQVPAGWRRPVVTFCANFDPLLQAQVLEQSSPVRCSAVDSMNFWIRSARPALCAVLRATDLAILNDGEVRELAGDRNLVRAAKAVRSGAALDGGARAGAGPSILIVKRGEHGVLALTPHGLLALPAYPTAIVQDPTGCGDTFAGTLLTLLALPLDESGMRWDAEEVPRLLTYDELRRALVHATVTASFTLESFGMAALAGLNAEAYEQRLDAYRAIIGLDARHL